MKFFRVNCKLSIVMTLAGLLYLVEAADDANKFKKCYNTSEETHCFESQYDTVNNRWLYVSFDNARRRCLDLNSTLLIIKNEEINQIVLQYWNEQNNPIRQQNVWTDAYRINDFNNAYAWHWIDPTLPTVKASDVAFTPDYKYYVAVLEFGYNSYYLTAKGPDQQFNYICEYSASKCSSSSSNNVRQFNDRCYAAITAQVNWYEARNRCIKDGGDLASFVNVTNINFTSWLDSIPYTRYFVGLQFTWYTWIDTGLAIGVGVGVGVGVPIRVAVTVLITCIVVRSGACFKKNAINNAAELSAVRETSVEQINDSTNDQYEQLNRNLDNSSGPTYDKLKVVPEQPYDELPTNID